MKGAPSRKGCVANRQKTRASTLHPLNTHKKPPLRSNSHPCYFSLSPLVRARPIFPRATPLTRQLPPTVQPPFLFFIVTFTLQLNPQEAFPLSDLLDKPWSQCLPYPLGTCLRFYRGIGIFSIPTFHLFMLIYFRRFLSNILPNEAFWPNRRECFPVFFCESSSKPMLGVIVVNRELFN